MRKVLFLALLLCISIGTYNLTYGLFSSAALNQNNSFIASESFPSPVLSATPTPTLVTQGGDVVINEVNWAGSAASTADEWIELRNMTSVSIDISNWVIENLGDNDNPNITIPSDTLIPGGGFFLIANYTSTDSNSRLNIDPNLVTTQINLNNSGEQLILKTNTSTIVDIANQASSWFKGSTGPPKKSMERLDLPGDGTESTNWQDALTHKNLDSGSVDFGSPKEVNGL